MFFNVNTKTHVEHILDAPDTYLGSVRLQTLETWVMEERKPNMVEEDCELDGERDEEEGDAEGGEKEAGGDAGDGASEAGSEAVSTTVTEKGSSTDSAFRIVSKEIQYVPGMFKLFDEAIVNCSDHAVRMREKIKEKVPNSLPVSYIHIDIDVENGVFTMQNDGNGMDVVMSHEHNKWVPELAFARLLTSTNFDKNEQKIVGGKNGYGFKLVLIWSSYGRLETVDHIRGLKYVQEFHDNMSRIDPPVITKIGTPSRPAKPYTKITFRPDYARLRLSSALSADLMSLFRRRVYDIASMTDAKVKVKFQGEPVIVRNFEKYVELYLGAKRTATRVYEKANERWEYAVALSPSGKFQQVSIVNGIFTSKGGKHVEYILGQITRKLVAMIEQKKKIKVKPSAISDQLMLFLRCTIVNPDFEGQTKDYLNTPSSEFGSTCVVSDKFLEKVAKLGQGVLNIACAITTAIEEKATAKKSNGTKRGAIYVPKLVDAHWAGTARSSECMLILCEGDSAKSGIVSGLVTEHQRNTIGVYPLKGKMLNVRCESQIAINKNEEITAIKKILGLEAGREYNTMEDVNKYLRYGKLCIMTDQDLDGSHIKGLEINFIHWLWSSLVRVSGFLVVINTPILKAHRGNDTVCFYNQGEINRWMESTPDANKWKFKYYKGLGTSVRSEFIEYFKNMKMVEFVYTPRSGAGAGTGATATARALTEEQSAELLARFANQTSDDAIDMVFNKSRADERKEWLRQYNPNRYLDTSKPQITFEEFIHNEFIHFSMYDCERSIPSVVDGLKPSQRKVLFGAFKRNLTNELKVAQFSAYVAEKSAYHHGEESLNQTIIGMAQNFVGSNNIALFVPAGQFGTRMMGGKDSASPRYIFTYLDPVTRHLFPKTDDAVLEYLTEDGKTIEPTFYVPILPMVLVNGASGIGTGTSTDVACYSPLELTQYLKDKLAGAPTKQDVFVPMYAGFHGTVEQLACESEGAVQSTSSSSTTFVFKGRYTKVNENTIVVTELPVGTWTSKYDEFIKKKLMGIKDDKDKDDKKNKKSASATASKNKKASAGAEGGDNNEKPLVKSCLDNSNDMAVMFEITFHEGKLAELEAKPVNKNGCNGVEVALKLFSTHTTSNMNLYNAKKMLTRYARVQDVLNEFYEVRLETYRVRRQCLLMNMEHELAIARDKLRFVTEVSNRTLILNDRDEEEIVAEMRARGYGAMPPKWKMRRVGLTSSEGEEGEEGAVDDSLAFANMEHLLRMRISSVSKKNVEGLRLEVERIEQEHMVLLNKSAEQIWLEDLEAFEVYYRSEFGKDGASKRTLEHVASAEVDAPVASGRGRKAVARPRPSVKTSVSSATATVTASLPAPAPSIIDPTTIAPIAKKSVPRKRATKTTA